MIETILAMTFTAVLLLAVAAVGMQAIQIYRKGITLNQIDQVNRTVYSDLQSAFEASPQGFVLNNTTYVPQASSSTSTGGGRICLQRYSFVWNNGIGTSATTKTPPNNYNGTYNGQRSFSLVRVYDPTNSMCQKTGGNYPDVPLPTAANHPTLDLINSDTQDTKNNRSLALQYLTVTPNNSSAPEDVTTGQTNYIISYALGTNTVDSLTTQPGTNLYICKTTTGLIGGAFEFCAVENFTIAARGGFGVN